MVSAEITKNLAEIPIVPLRAKAQFNKDYTFGFARYNLLNFRQETLMMQASTEEPAFRNEMVNLYTRAKWETGYNASRFLQLIDELGGIEAARFLINSPEPASGYTELYQLGRLDITVEALVVKNERWHILFEKSTISKAKKRLNDYGYDV